MLTLAPQMPVDRFMEDQLFEEDVRCVVKLMRPHRRERLEGWQEYRAGGANFRATISWSTDFAPDDQNEPLLVPRMADVLEAILIGSARRQDELTAEQEFRLYRDVVQDLYQRLTALESQSQ